MMSINEAAVELGVSPKTVYRLVSDHKIGHYRIGGKVVLSRQDITDYLASVRVPAATLRLGQKKRMILGDDGIMLVDHRSASVPC